MTSPREKAREIWGSTEPWRVEKECGVSKGIEMGQRVRTLGRKKMERIKERAAVSTV